MISSKATAEGMKYNYRNFSSGSMFYRSLERVIIYCHVEEFCSILGC